MKSSRKTETLVIGSGAAGLAAAVRLAQFGCKPVIYTEGLRMGTSINTGSDKQTYYKLGMYGTEPDSPGLMAGDMMSGGSMHGDLALCEAALSVPSFMMLTGLGVPFPHDQYGQYVGYKTDHDPKRRATSCGPYTSREMCLALIADLKRREIEVVERMNAVKLLTDPEKQKCIGAIFLNRKTGDLETVLAENTVFAVGGPGGLYETSVYPSVHTGAIGLALEAGASARNLAESQFGLASLKFRWNVSGSYMQVLPRFVSVDENGTEREFLRDYFETSVQMYDMIFLKGYQWPFSAGHVPGSSLIDIFTYIETVERGHRVYLDYRSDPEDMDFSHLSPETREYLERSGAMAETPLERLKRLNAPAVELYRQHKIDLAREMLEVAVCAQHNNGGLAGDIWWESVNLKHLFPVGEVNGSHGVTRPGGTALNAGQAGALRAAERIAMRPAENFETAQAEQMASAAVAELEERMKKPAVLDWRRERRLFQHRMSDAGAFIRSADKIDAALDDTVSQLRRLLADGLGGLSPDALAEALRNCQLCRAQLFYLESIREQIAKVGSRGGSVVLSRPGKRVHPKLPDVWQIAPENLSLRGSAMICESGEDGMPVVRWEKCRPVPSTDGWFENVWRDYRENKLHNTGK